MTEKQEKSRIQRGNAGDRHKFNTFPVLEGTKDLFDSVGNNSSDRLDYTDWQSLPSKIPGYGNMPLYGVVL